MIDLSRRYTHDRQRPNTNPPTARRGSALSSHTPGPWYSTGEIVIAKDGTWIKPYHKDSWEGDRKWPSPEEQAANAILIAAAPDLLNERDRLQRALETIIMLDPGAEDAGLLAVTVAWEALGDRDDR